MSSETKIRVLHTGKTKGSPKQALFLHPSSYKVVDVAPNIHLWESHEVDYRGRSK